MDVQAETELWTEFLSGNRTAFSQLYDRYADVLFSFGLRYSSDRDLVKDCIHDLFIDLHHYRAGLAREVNIRFYLLKSLRRKLEQAHRKSALFRHETWENESVLAISPFSFSIEDEIITDESQKELLQLLAEEVNRLPERQREILYLRFRHDFDYEQIASLMQISVPTCRTFIYRALKQLRGKLELLTLLFLLFLVE
ncbi:RNA polymerase sigma factor [Siphonobacter aquaeclarae]|uniref:RNA polymerase sigma factor, sigma-70 family n=1 Tax=Siphonobacter aquaeclarae TaxID=563176 RepID=A0A1G9QKE0_9BACT|nr:sigma-70 family RNA polymerase sigma factor [Siphonobacter aquaeclarae]SDM10957.1 RNA polymerase sigma factor, sigma-70 family [Siphonobacter aquaeclarae]